MWAMAAGRVQQWTGAFLCLCLCANGMLCDGADVPERVAPTDFMSYQGEQCLDYAQSSIGNLQPTLRAVRILHAQTGWCGPPACELNPALRAGSIVFPIFQGEYFTLALYEGQLACVNLSDGGPEYTTYQGGDDTQGFLDGIPFKFVILDSHRFIVLTNFIPSTGELVGLLVAGYGTYHRTESEWEFCDEAGLFEEWPLWEQGCLAFHEEEPGILRSSEPYLLLRRSDLPWPAEHYPVP